MYGSDVKVIRKGDRGWTSDEEHEREIAARDPRQKYYNGDKAPLRPRIVHDWGWHHELLDEALTHGGDEIFVPGTNRVRMVDGPDVLVFELRHDGTWRYCYRERNAAL